MLTFHEGLPGSGKSYAAVQDYLLPAVKAGQTVWTNIKGINHEAIALYCGIDVEQAQNLVQIIPWEKTKDAADIVTNDALVIIDEVQDFWPVSNKPLSPRDMEFVTQHRQRGLELVACGQVMRDVHSLWKRRVERKVMFVNQEAVGKPNNYLWTSYNATQPEVFQEIASGTGEYKPEVYSCYKSHADGVKRTQKTKDDRFNPFKAILNSKFVWAYLVAFGFAVYIVADFFDKDKAAERFNPNHNAKVQSNEQKTTQVQTPTQVNYASHNESKQPFSEPAGANSQPTEVHEQIMVKGFSKGLRTNVVIESGGITRIIRNPEQLQIGYGTITFILDGKEVTAWHSLGK